MEIISVCFELALLLSAIHTRIVNALLIECPPESEDRSPLVTVYPSVLYNLSGIHIHS